MNPQDFMNQVNGVSQGAPPAGTSQGTQAQTPPSGHKSPNQARMTAAGITAAAWILLAVIAVIMGRLGGAK